MLEIKTNIQAVLKRIEGDIKKIEDPEYMLRPVMIELIPIIHERIHEKGQDASGSAIGDYKDSYMKTREKHGRKEGKKVVISLTRQLENDYAVVATQKGYGIGFNNPLNFDKVGWVEEHFDKKIFSLTRAEEVYAHARFEELAREALK